MLGARESGPGTGDRAVTRPAPPTEEPATGAARRWWRSDRLTTVLLAVPVIAMPLLGALAGLVWAAVAERPDLVLTPSGTVYGTPEPQAVIAADGWFAVVTAVAGALCGIVAFLYGRSRLDTRLREIVVLLGLTLGGLLAALSTWGVGHATGLAEFRRLLRTQPTGSHVTGVLQLHAVGLVVVWSISAVIFFTLLLAVCGRKQIAS